MRVKTDDKFNLLNPSVTVPLPRFEIRLCELVTHARVVLNLRPLQKARPSIQSKKKSKRLEDAHASKLLWAEVKHVAQARERRFRGTF